MQGKGPLQHRVLGGKMSLTAESRPRRLKSYMSIRLVLFRFDTESRHGCGDKSPAFEAGPTGTCP